MRPGSASASLAAWTGALLSSRCCLLPLASTRPPPARRRLTSAAVRYRKLLKRKASYCQELRIEEDQAATLAVKFGLRLQDLVETFHPSLTMVEGLKLAALTFDRDVSKLSCCATCPPPGGHGCNWGLRSAFTGMNTGASSPARATQRAGSPGPEGSGQQSATVRYDADKVRVEQMIQAINQAGFRANLARSG